MNKNALQTLIGNLRSELADTDANDSLKGSTIRYYIAKAERQVALSQAPAEGEAVAWFPTYPNGEIVRNYGDGSPVFACRTKADAEQAKRCHLGATGPVVPLYTAPPAAAGDSADSLREMAEALPLPDGYEVTEFPPGQWSYEYDRADGERMACGTNWFHPALAACAAWESYADGLSRPAASARVPDDRVQYIIGKLEAHAAKADARRRGYSDGVPSHTAMLVSETVELIRKLAAPTPGETK